MSNSPEYLVPPGQLAAHTSVHWLVRKRKHDDQHALLILQWNPGSQGWTPINEHATWRGNEKLPASEWAHVQHVPLPDIDAQVAALEQMKARSA